MVAIVSARLATLAANCLLCACDVRSPGICGRDAQLTYVVNESCIRCKTIDCVEVCPVDCFYEGENMLVIHPDECIDCSVCVPECPVDAIKPDTEPGIEKWLSLNAEYAKIWPQITVKKVPRPTLRSGRGSRTNSNTSRQVPAPVARSPTRCLTP